jgi:plasmid stabilization system protein ParE
MRYKIAILRRADADVQTIYNWLKKRSTDGAIRWLEAFRAAIQRLTADAATHAKGAESSKLRVDILECYFKTRHGRRYRIVYLIAGDHIRVLRVRGPGQRLLRRSDLG